MIYCGRDLLASYCDQYSLNMNDYSPKLIEISDSKSHALATTLVIGQAPSILAGESGGQAGSACPNTTRQEFLLFVLQCRHLTLL